MPPKTKAVWSPPIAAVLAGGAAALMGMYSLVLAAITLSALRVAAGKGEPQYGTDELRVARLEYQLQVIDRQLDLGIYAVLAVLLGVGGVLMLIRRSGGPTMVIIGSGLTMFTMWGAGATTPATAVSFGILSLVPICMLICALLPSTQRWIGSRNPQFTATNIPRPPVPPYN
ncbi:hypothetical protein [Nocardia lasii]|uniref:Uncharacterized protein n=1 Tax=Nocardia lasii TaxID=1616107 RepID=A0ABW1JQM6_9NOCA